MGEYLKGKGAQFNPKNRYLKNFIESSDYDGLDAPLLERRPSTKVFYESPKTAVSINDSPDLKMTNSINPYQGCEHGCVYCFARNTHEYWGFGAGLDFESKIIVKKNLADRLRTEFLNPKWKVNPIMLSGNTDCYQPLERKHKITRQILQVMLEFNHPIGILTKNILILRDLDLLKELSSRGLVHVYFSITTLDERLRRVLEPRTASILKKLRAIEKFRDAGIPVGVMNAPIIPGLNHHEIPQILKTVAEAGANTVGYTVVRLNGVIGDIMKDWIEKNFPDRFNKIWNQVKSMHGGNVNDSKWGRRITGEGNVSKVIHDLFTVSKLKYFGSSEMPSLNREIFRRSGSYNLFE